jgi:hypothetical protein
VSDLIPWHRTYPLSPGLVKSRPEGRIQPVTHSGRLARLTTSLQPDSPKRLRMRRTIPTPRSVHVVQSAGTDKCRFFV